MKKCRGVVAKCDVLGLMLSNTKFKGECYLPCRRGRGQYKGTVLGFTVLSRLGRGLGAEWFLAWVWNFGILASGIKASIADNRHGVYRNFTHQIPGSDQWHIAPHVIQISLYGACAQLWGHASSLVHNHLYAMAPLDHIAVHWPAALAGARAAR